MFENLTIDDVQKSKVTPSRFFFYKNRVDLAEVGATLSNVVVAGSCVRGCNV